MDYEKAYKQALERAKKNRELSNCPSRAMLEEVFPELRESEDERMYNKIIDYLLGRIDVMPSNINERKILVAWLEKQKESLHISESCKDEWSKEDEMYLSQAIETLEHENYLVLADKLKSLRPSWKPFKDEERLINTSISFLKDFADKGYENAVECIDWLKSKL